MSTNIANNGQKNIIYQSKNGAISIHHNPENPDLSDLDNLILSLCEIPQSFTVKHVQIRFENQRGAGIMVNFE